MTHQLPVHEVRDAVQIRLAQISAVVRKHLVLVEERHHPGHDAAVMPHDEDLAVLLEGLVDGVKEPAWEDRGSQVAD